jgi:hypothetical protein
MEPEQVISLVEDVNFAMAMLQEAENPPPDIATTAVNLVDESYREEGREGILKKVDWESKVLENALIEEGKQGPDLWVYTCYPKGEPDSSNNYMFTEYQLKQFSKTHGGLPLLFNHVDGLQAGVVLDGALNNKGELMGTFMLFNNDCGKVVKSLLEAKVLTSVSLGALHNPQQIDGITNITHAGLKEVSVCAAGDLPGTKLHGRIPWERRKDPSLNVADLTW